ncbi:adenine-specific DNA methylase [Clostridium sp.]|uniref:adenine-specific DNA methylase n=1 Tax=Clostridium sp. TaxID=1506 RepID=UPI00262735D9|nr:adenine-specific DNA methylase [Clostridium sp.]
MINIEINRIWSMPNSKTFNIKPIKELIHKYIKDNQISIDPFANNSKIANITNDLDTQYDTTYHFDALEFLKQFDDNSIDLVLYDPPYSPRQVSECYKKLNQTVNMSTTQASYWSNHKKEIGRITKENGIVITCGWNSGGIGKKYGFEIIEILLVPHGGWHNDTIITVEKKIHK